jgi:hypothetical protein
MVTDREANIYGPHAYRHGIPESGEPSRSGHATPPLAT